MRAAIRRPVLLVQGLADPAAPAYELEQLRARLRADGVEVQYLAAADEGAAFTRASGRLPRPIARTLRSASCCVTRGYCADRMVARRGTVRSAGRCPA